MLNFLKKLFGFESKPVEAPVPFPMEKPVEAAKAETTPAPVAPVTVAETKPASPKKPRATAKKPAASKKPASPKKPRTPKAPKA